MIRLIIFQIVVLLLIAFSMMPRIDQSATKFFIDSIPTDDRYAIGNESGLGAEFDLKLAEVAATLGYPTDWFIAVMKSESAINPTAVNRYTGAIGLIQFMPGTLSDMGSSVAQVKKSDALYQLDLILKFYQGTSFQTLTEMRLFTFYPKALGKADTYQIGGRTTARQNHIYDLNGDLRITVEEFKRFYDESAY